MNLTIAELERRAFVAGDSVTLAALRACEDEQLIDAPTQEEVNALEARVDEADLAFREAEDEAEARAFVADLVCDKLEACGGLTEDACIELARTLRDLADDLPTTEREKDAARKLLAGAA